MTGFYPDGIAPPPRPLGFVRSMLAVVRNPIEMWSEDMFDGEASSIGRPGHRFVTITNPELAKEVLLDQAGAFRKSTLVNRLLKPALGNSLVTTDGDSWKAQRRAVSPVFRYEKIAALMPKVADIGRHTAASLASQPEGEAVDMMHEMVASTLDVIVYSLFGDPGDAYDRDNVSRDITTYFDTHGNLDLADYLGFPEWFPRRRHKGREAVRRMRQVAQAVVEARKSSGEDGSELTALLSVARDPDTGQQLTMEEVVDNVLTFIGAGHETTALAVTWALSIIAHLPELQDDLGRELREICGEGPIEAEDIARLDLHNRVIMETMRLYPPAPAIGRSAVEPVRIGDLDIKPGDHLTLAIYVMQRHRKYWDDPLMFDPDRFAEGVKLHHRFAYMPFGGGARICVGMKLAQMEAALLLASLMRELRFSPDPSHQIYPQMNITLRPKGGMPLFVHPAG